MRERILIGAAVVTGIWAVAVSKPDAENSRTPDRTAAAVAPVNLAKTPVTGASVVSGLEAGRDPTLTLPRPPASKPTELTVRGSGTAKVARPGGDGGHSHAAMAAAELVPTMQVTTTSLASVAPNVAPSAIPLAAWTGAGQAMGSDGSDGVEQRPSVVSRGPAIIIRGGMGSARDDCDLHRRPGFGAFGTGGGIAVNRIAPQPGRSMGGPMIANPAGLRIR